MKNKFKTRIKELRARHDLTQERLIDIAGVRREKIGHFEHRKYNLSLLLA